MTRKRLVLAAAIVAIVGLAAAGTNAFITSEAHTTNVITTAKIDIDLIESTMVDGEKIEWPGDGITGVMPGQNVSKIVEVENKDGSGPAWVRVHVDSEIQKAGETEREDGSELLSFDLSDQWIEGKGENAGYYYYSQPVAPGQTTPPLFTKVTFAGAMDNSYQNCTAYVHVSAQAVQVKNNGADLTALTADNYTQVQGWPSDAAAEPGNTTGGDTTGGDTTGGDTTGGDTTGGDTTGGGTTGGDTTGGGTSSGTPVEP